MGRNTESITLALRKELAEARAEIKSDREDYESWRDRYEERLKQAQADHERERSLRERFEYEYGRQLLRVDSLLYALVLAQNHAKLAQDRVAALEAKRARTGEVALAS